MAFKEGEVYKCPDADCGCEVTVTKAAHPAREATNRRAAAAASRWSGSEGDSCYGGGVRSRASLP